MPLVSQEQILCEEKKFWPTMVSLSFLPDSTKTYIVLIYIKNIYGTEEQ